MTKNEEAQISEETAEMLALATECIEWHAANCATCLTGVTCGAAAENIAYLEGYGVTQTVNGNTETVKAQWRPEGGKRGGNQYGAYTVRYASEKQISFLGKLFGERDMSNVTDIQRTALRMAQDALKSGKCNLRLASDTIEILLACPVMVTASTVRTDGPTEKQVAFYSRLHSEKDTTDAASVAEFKSMSKSQASKEIDRLLSAPRKSVTVQQVQEIKSGIYRVNDRIFKVYRGQSGRMLAKVLTVHGEGDASFEYQGIATRFVPAGTSPMTLAEAKEFGAIYGVCCNCGRTLTDENSIEAGIGPVCAAKFGA